jgi:uncharacterized protein DUF4232
MRRTRTSMVAGTMAVIVILGAVPAALAAFHDATTPPTCTRDQLGVKLHDTQGALGTIHGAWVFTNHSATSCLLNGYPDLQLYGRTGRPLPTTVNDTLPPAPTDVTLAPAGSATFFSTYSDVQIGTDPCRTSEVIQITAPNVVDPLFIPAELQACGGVIDVSAVKPGIHHA